MKTIFCSKCFNEAVFQESGHDEQLRIFNLYFCPACENYTRDFNLTERQTVDEALRTEALRTEAPRTESPSDKPRQMRMFPAAHVSD